MDRNLPVLIIGGGIVGLTLAQALRKANIPYVVFERDASLQQNTEGWGLTIHWALPALESCLPPKLFERLLDTQVDKDQGSNDTGRFVFLNLQTCEPKFIIPPSKRLRVHRQKLRKLLSEGVRIQYNKTLLNLTQTSGSILAHFDDGTNIEGALMIGADGSSSRTRRLLFAMNPSAGALNPLPIRFMGVTIRLDPFQAQNLRDIDPLLFQGAHPETGTYMWYSTLSTPETNGSKGSGYNEYFEGQLMISWVYRSETDEIPGTDRERVQRMKFLAQPFDFRLRTAVWDIPDDARVQVITIQDWLPQTWDNLDSRVTLIGEAAHAMTMFRGDAFNHGITDAMSLGAGITKAWSHGYDPDRLEMAVEAFEPEMRRRTYDAVLLSRQACLDAHDIVNLSMESPLLSRRGVE